MHLLTDIRWKFDKPGRRRTRNTDHAEPVRQYQAVVHGQPVTVRVFDRAASGGTPVVREDYLECIAKAREYERQTYLVGSDYYRDANNRGEAHKWELDRND